MSEHTQTPHMIGMPFSCVGIFSLFSYSFFLSGCQDFPAEMTAECRRNRIGQQPCGLCAKNPSPLHCTFSGDRGSLVLRTEVHSWCWAPLLDPTFYDSREMCNDPYCRLVAGALPEWLSWERFGEGIKDRVDFPMI